MAQNSTIFSLSARISKALDSNISVYPGKNSIKIVNTLLPIFSKTIVISHGSSGVGDSEISIANFFLRKGYPVQIIDHFMPLGIQRLNWGQANFEDRFEVSLGDLLDTFDDVKNSESVHIGMSLGGYLGMARSDLFCKVYAFYPGILPLPSEEFAQNRDKFCVFIPENDNWCKFPEIVANCLNSSQFINIPGAYHSFMSLDKNKVVQVFKYEFHRTFVPRDELKNYKLSHKRLSEQANYEMLNVELRSDALVRESILNFILRELVC